MCAIITTLRCRTLPSPRNVPLCPFADNSFLHSQSRISTDLISVSEICHSWTFLSEYVYTQYNHFQALVHFKVFPILYKSVSNDHLNRRGMGACGRSKVLSPCSYLHGTWGCRGLFSASLLAQLAAAGTVSRKKRHDDGSLFGSWVVMLLSTCRASARTSGWKLLVTFDCHLYTHQLWGYFLKGSTNYYITGRKAVSTYLSRTKN